MSSQAGSRSEYLIGKAGTEYIAQKLAHEDPRVFLSQFQAAHGISPSNDTYHAFFLFISSLKRAVLTFFASIEAR